MRKTDIPKAKVRKHYLQDAVYEGANPEFMNANGHNPMMPAKWIKVRKGVPWRRVA